MKVWKWEQPWEDWDYDNVSTFIDGEEWHCTTALPLPEDLNKMSKVQREIGLMFLMIYQPDTEGCALFVPYPTEKYNVSVYDMTPEALQAYVTTYKELPSHDELREVRVDGEWGRDIINLITKRR